MIINFCIRHHPDAGGTYTSECQFKNTAESYIIDINHVKSNNPSQANFTILGSTNPFAALMKAKREDFFSFIPPEIIEKATAIIAHGLFVSHFSYAYCLSVSLGIPLYIVPHGGLDPYVFSYRSWRKKLWMALIGRAAIKHAKRIIFSTIREKEKSVFPVDDSQAFICPWAVDPPQRIDRSVARAILRTKLGLDENDKILLYFARIHGLKRPLETLEAFLKVQPLGWKMLIVGPNYDDRIMAKISSYSQQYTSIIVHPPVFGEEKWDLIAGADLYILLSKRENFGFTVAEAASVGTPIYISEDVDIYPFFADSPKRVAFEIISDRDILTVVSSLEDLTTQDLSQIGTYCRDVSQKNFSLDSFNSNIRYIIA